MGEPDTKKQLPENKDDLGSDHQELNDIEHISPKLFIAGNGISRFIRMFIPSFLRHAVYHLNHRVAQAIAYENETGARFQALPVAFGIGVLAYFVLPREPQIFALILAFIASIFIAFRTYGRTSGNIALIAVCIFGGMSTGKLRTDYLATKMIGKTTQARITGIVMNREIRANKRLRYTIKVTSLDGKSKIIPQVIRASVTAKYQPIGIGQGISGLVRLRRPSGPAYPGGYDFAFQSWFKGIGANGFFLGAPKELTNKFQQPLNLRLNIWISTVRASISARIRQTLPGESGALAAALIVGDRSGISEETTEALRRSGLAHILAISGLHMALVTTTIIFFVRGLLALLPNMALYYPIRKWAAAIALVTATGYLVLSGSSIATQRAWVMIAVMLFAILRDRKALTMRNVGLAALVILVWRPESILSPGFQMSFAAVAALIAIYESWSRHKQNRQRFISQNWVISLLTRSAKAITGLGVTSIVAGIATGLFAAYHFHRVAPFGLLANLAAMPLVSLAVMPLALASMVLMSFGLEMYPLNLMGMAVDKVVEVARYVAAIGPSGNTGVLPLSSVLLGTLALLVATQLKTNLRLLALPAIVLAFYFYSINPMPDILISESGNSIAVRNQHGHLDLLKPRKEKFITNIWKKAFSPGQIAAIQAKKKPNSLASTPYKCDALGCTIVVGKKAVLAIVSRPQAFEEDCQRADIIVSEFRVPVWCDKPKLIIDKQALSVGGSRAIYFMREENVNQPHTFRVVQSNQSSFRPWNRHRTRPSNTQRP